ncbi:uncharacterized protein LOC113215130 [Frankliniella occidentalis]|uniref:Uncharacterized protein LOC113215130 n=1 Tax=Frankliniella occidentalis TaxID=133901 RepID=A0A6J1TCJ4_FRAOC|nr:uncharacterized protein LOC113215130 [Frankliniella occidentalis]
MALYHEETRSPPFKRRVLNFKLLVASSAGNKDEVIRLVGEDGADLHYKDSDGNTCLHYAANAEKRSQEVITQLLDRGANRSAENNNCETALDIAFQSKNYDSMQQIITTLYDDAGQLFADNTKLQQNIGGQHDHMGEKQEFDLFDATLHCRYDYKYMSEIDMLLKFLWAPCISTEVDVRLYVIFYMSLDKKKFIRLSVTDSQTTLLTSWTTVDNNKDQVEGGRDKFIEFLSDDKDDPITSAIAKAIIVSDWIRDKNKSKNLNTGQLHDLVSSFKFSHIEWRVFFANVLNEVKRTTKKAKKCTDFLRGAQKGMSFKTANAILYSIETFAVQDTYCATIPMPKDQTDLLKRCKKAYFKRVYNAVFRQKNVVDVLSTFATLRQHILKKSGLFQISLDTFRSFIEDKLKMKMEQFLSAMSDFAETVEKNLQIRPGQANHRILQQESQNVFKVLKQNAVQFGSAERYTTPTEISDSIRKFCENVDKLSEEPSRLQKVVFDLLVNVFPRLTEEKSPLGGRLSQLRNSIMHDFQNLTATQVSQNIPSAVIDMYRYELALNMSEVLKCFRNDEDFLDLRTDLSSVIEKTGKHYANLRLYTSKGTGHLSDAYDSAWIEKEISKIVSTYVNCLAPILDCSDHKDEDIVHSLPELSSLQKREIFEKWWAVQKISGDTEEKRRLDKSLCSDYMEKLGLSELAAQLAVLSSFTSINNSANITLEEEIKNEVNGLLHLSIFGKNHISTRYVIVLFEYFMNDKDSFNRHIGQNDISPQTRILIEERLKLILNNQQTKQVEWGQGKLVEVNKSAIVLNILKILNEVERAYQLKYETVSSALEDPAFVLYLVDIEVKQNDAGVTHCVLQNPFRINRLARELPRIDFMAPFLAAILAKTGDLHVFDHNSLNVLLKTILQGSADISYVGSLISLLNDRVTQIMFDIIVKEDVGKEKAQFVLTEITLNGDLEKCIKRLEITRKLEVSNIELRIASLANEAVLEKLYAQKLDHAETLINEVTWSLAQIRLARTSLLTTDSPGKAIRRTSCPSYPFYGGDEVLNISHSRNAVHSGEYLKEGTLTDETSTERILFGDNNIIIGLNLLKAKLYNARGEQLCKCAQFKQRQDCEGKKKFQQARSILKNIRDSFQGQGNTTRNYMLALSRSAHTALKLRKCEHGGVEFVKEALTYEKEIWRVLWRTIAMSDEPPPTDCLTFLNRADGSKKYKALMADTEFWRYLNVEKVWKNIAHHKALLGSLLNKTVYIERATQMLREHLALCAKRTDLYTTFLRSKLHKHLSSNYRILAKISQNQDNRISYFYQAKRLEFILIHYKSGLGWYNIDSDHTKYCSDNANKAIKSLRAIEKYLTFETVDNS